MLLDMNLPGMSGFSVLQEMQDAKYQKVPVVILTARSMDAGTMDILCSQPNVRGVLGKPVEVRKLRSKMRAVLEYVPASKSESQMI